MRLDQLLGHSWNSPIQTASRQHTYLRQTRHILQHQPPSIDSSRRHHRNHCPFDHSSFALSPPQVILYRSATSIEQIDGKLGNQLQKSVAYYITSHAIKLSTCLAPNFQPSFQNLNIVVRRIPQRPSPSRSPWLTRRTRTMSSTPSPCSLTS